VNDIQTLIARLKDLEQGCEDKFIDFKILKFDIQENEMKLFNDTQMYYFKNDPKNPKDQRITHAVNQFCKIMEVPYSFFAKNPEYMKKDIVSCWLPTLTPEMASILGKLRKLDKGYVIRALLPVEFTNITNSQVMEALSHEVLDDFKIDFIIGDEKDDLILHVRFISKEEFDVCGEKCSVGFSVVCSELGASPLSVDTLLYRSLSKGSLVATYSTESFFSFEYEKMQKTDLQSMFPPLMVHLREKLGDIKQKIQEAKEASQKKENIQELLRNLKLVKGLNDKFHTKIFQEVEKNEEVKTKWDFVNKMAIVAKDFPVDKRLKIERAAGNLLGLVFSKE
jgi:hypothetical protein